MNEVILILVSLVVNYFDFKRDATNNASEKWPNKGWRICLEPKTVTPYVLYASMSGLQGHARTLKTVDPWHVRKWISFYTPWVYITALVIWPELAPPWYMLGVAAIVGILVWKTVEKPDHWT